MSQIIDISCNQLRAGDNVRKTFDADKLAGLKMSIREHGIQQNLVGYRDPENEDVVVIVAGERRWRATCDLLVELSEERNHTLMDLRAALPVKIIPPEEVPHAKEINLLENLQRDDITPAEEADGYADMLARVNPATGEKYTIAELAQKLGLPGPGHITRRLNLRKAPAALLEAMAAGIVPAALLEMVGRIPDEKARTAAAREVLSPGHQDAPMTVAQARAHIAENFMRSLKKGCDFDPDDAGLVPVTNDDQGNRASGGACDDCPFRTGNMAELQDELGGSAGGIGGKSGGGKAGINPNVCTHPGCFRLKTAAQWEKRKEEKLIEVRKLAEKETDPKEKGKALIALQERFIIEGERAKKIFGGYNGEISYDAAFARASEKPRADLVHYLDEDERPTWKQLAAEVGAPVVLAFNPHTNKTEYLIETAPLVEKVKEFAKKKGAKSVFDRAPGAAAGHPEMAAAREKVKLDAERAKIGATTLRDAMAKKGLDVDAWRVIFELVMDQAGADGAYFIGKWLGLERRAGENGAASGRDYSTPILEYVDNLCGENPAQWQQWTVLALVSKSLKWSGVDADDFARLAELFGIDVSKIDAAAREALAPKKPAEKRGKAEAEAAGKALDEHAAAQAETGRRGDGETGRKKPAAKKAEKKAPSKKAAKKAPGKRAASEERKAKARERVARNRAAKKAAGKK